jgi:hypothetical protein
MSGMPFCRSISIGKVYKYWFSLPIEKILFPVL